MLEENGYLSTSENLAEGCLRIFDVREMARKSEMIMNNVHRRIKKLNACMTCTNVNELDQKELRKHLLACNKVTSSLHSMNSTLSTVNYR